MSTDTHQEALQSVLSLYYQSSMACSGAIDCFVIRMSTNTILWPLTFEIGNFKNTQSMFCQTIASYPSKCHENLAYYFRGFSLSHGVWHQLLPKKYIFYRRTSLCREV